MANFAEACRLLGPALDFARIPWRRSEEQYDNFDRVAEALFLSLVVEPCLFHANAEDATAARYGFSYDEPPPAHFRVNGKFRFVALETRTRPFDTARHEKGELPMANATFAFVLKSASITREFRSIDLRA
jgi:hypothetical protein